MDRLRFLCKIAAASGDEKARLEALKGKVVALGETGIADGIQGVTNKTWFMHDFVNILMNDPLCSKLRKDDEDDFLFVTESYYVLPFLLHEVVGQIPAQGDALLVLPVHVRHLAAELETPALRELQEASGSDS